MSNDRDKPKPGGTRGGVIPAELVPFLREQERPKMQRLGEDPELDAAVAAFKALDHAPDDVGPPVQDLSIGMGNASAYVGATEVKAAKVPTAKSEPSDGSAAKVEIAIDDVPRALPEGSRTRETVETKVLRLRPGDDVEGTVPRAPAGRTVGGGTARIPVVKAASPWAKEVPAALVAPVELPSAHAPSTSHEPASQPPAASGRGRGKGIVLAGILLGLAGIIVFRVATTRTEGREMAASAVPSAAPLVAATANTMPSASTNASVGASQLGTAASGTVPVPSTNPSAQPSVTTSAVVPAPTGAVVKRGTRPRPEDPYDAAPSAPNPTVAPTTAPAVVPSVAPSVAPSAPSASPSSTKPGPAGGDRVIWN